MADIFISYSSKDRAQAEQLIELLSSAGLSVWIDKSGIGAATSWSEEIVHALDACTACVVLLSPSSIESKNVARELALAFEKNKKILPLDLEPVQLPASMQYHLAGLQRTSMTNIDSIIRALGTLGLEATSAPSINLVRGADDRKSVMILPFEDLSPSGDNAWFADGIVSELISALSNVKALRVSDAQATKEFKSYRGQLTKYAREMDTRYFVQGDVRKFGDNIKITSRLLDIETGDHLWQDSLKGTMEDIFDIQEQVAEKVVEGLRIHLFAGERRRLLARGTENVQAYELKMRGDEYQTRSTREAFHHAIELFSEAIKLDPSYANAYSNLAHVLVSLYHHYERNPAHLKEAHRLVLDSLRLRPDHLYAYSPLCRILMHQGKVEEAVRTAELFIKNASDDPASHFVLGFIYSETGQYAKAIAPYEASLKLAPTDIGIAWNLIVSLSYVQDLPRLKQASVGLIPLVEKHLRLMPDDVWWRVNYALVLHFAGRDEDSLAAVLALSDVRDGHALYNAACLLCMLKDHAKGIAYFLRALEAGWGNSREILDFLRDEDGGIGSLAGTSEHDAVRALIERHLAEQEATANG